MPKNGTRDRKNGEEVYREKSQIKKSEVKRMQNEIEKEIERLKEREQTPLLDAVSWGNVLVDGLSNPILLEKKGNLFRSDENPVAVRLKDGTTFCRIEITDPEIGVFKAGAILQGNNKIQYGNLHTTIKDNALWNMIGNTAEETIDSLRDRLRVLRTKYGVMTDLTRITLKKMEIQRTFRLDDSYERYQRVLKRIFCNFPPRSRFKNLIKFGKTEKETVIEETFYTNSYKNKKSENYREIKVYDKSKDMQKKLGIDFGESWVRLELTLIGRKTIENALGTRDLEVFLGAAIPEYFVNQMQELIVKPYYQWKKNRDKELLELLKEQRIRDPKRWVNDSLIAILNREVSSGGVPFVLGIDEILAVVDQMGLDRKTKSRVKKRFILLGYRNAGVLMNGDDVRMKELIDKLDATKCYVLVDEKCDTQNVIKTK